MSTKAVLHYGGLDIGAGTVGMVMLQTKRLRVRSHPADHLCDWGSEAVCWLCVLATFQRDFSHRFLFWFKELKFTTWAQSTNTNREEILLTDRHNQIITNKITVSQFYVSQKQKGCFLNLKMRLLPDQKQWKSWYLHLLFVIYKHGSKNAFPFQRGWNLCNSWSNH